MGKPCVVRLRSTDAMLPGASRDLLAGLQQPAWASTSRLEFSESESESASRVLPEFTFASRSRPPFARARYFIARARTHALFPSARHGRPSTFSGAGRSCRRSCRGVGSHRLERPEPSELVFEQARPGRGFFLPARSLTRRCSDGVNISACAAGGKASGHEVC